MHIRQRRQANNAEFTLDKYVAVGGHMPLSKLPLSEDDFNSHLTRGTIDSHVSIS